MAEGTYKPTSGTDRTAIFQLKSGVAVYGDFAGTESSRDERNSDPATSNTVLSGDLAGDDNRGGDDHCRNSYPTGREML